MKFKCSACGRVVDETRANWGVLIDELLRSRVRICMACMVKMAGGEE